MVPQLVPRLDGAPTDRFLMEYTVSSLMAAYAGTPRDGRRGKTPLPAGGTLVADEELGPHQEVR